jgi:hypothetical protein
MIVGIKQEKALEWDGFHSFQIVSLLEMLHKYALGFYHVGEQLGSLKMISQTSDRDLKIDDDVLEIINGNLDVAANWCGKLNLRMSVLGVERAKGDIADNPTADQVNRSVEELHNRINDEIWPILLMYLTPEQVEWYKKQDAFGEDVAKKFPSAGFDIEEASKCYALGRDTACVMHLMRALEIGMRGLAQHIEVSIENNPTWTNVLDKIDDEIKKPYKKSIWNTAESEWFSDAAKHIRTYVKARNRTQHPDKKYTPEEARRIFDAVCELMQHLATRIEETSEGTYVIKPVAGHLKLTGHEVNVSVSKVSDKMESDGHEEETRSSE